MEGWLGAPHHAIMLWLLVGSLDVVSAVVEELTQMSSCDDAEMDAVQNKHDGCIADVGCSCLI